MMVVMYSHVKQTCQCIAKCLHWMGLQLANMKVSDFQTRFCRRERQGIILLQEWSQRARALFTIIDQITQK